MKVAEIETNIVIRFSFQKDNVKHLPDTIFANDPKNPQPMSCWTAMRD